MNSPMPVSLFADAEDRVLSRRPQRCHGFTTSETYGSSCRQREPVVDAGTVGAEGQPVNYSASYRQTAGRWS
jgi:hypothetical protein